MCVVYKATCKICDDSYIGQTQQKLKDQMGQHLNAVNKLITKGIKQVRLVCEPLALHIIARKK